MKYCNAILGVCLSLFISLQFSSCRDHNELTKLGVFDLSMKVPANYVNMNGKQYLRFFTRDNSLFSNQINEQAKNIDYFLKNSTSMFFQDTLDCKNNFVMYESPYVKINKSTKKQFQNVFHKMLQDKYADSIKVNLLNDGLYSGAYPFAKFVYKKEDNKGSTFITYYVLNRENKLITIIFTTKKEIDFDSIIKTIE